MQVRHPERSEREGRAAKENAERPGNVYSLATARRRRAAKEQQKRLNRTTPDLTEFDTIDVTGLDLDRFTPGARQLYWYNVTHYARFLYASASDGAVRDKRLRDAPISTENVQNAEDRRLNRVQKRQADLGWGFLLDALQILAAAACGALATRPLALEGAGPWPLVVALTATVCIFVAREYFVSRAYD